MEVLTAAAAGTDPRCPWAVNVPQVYVDYHDREWGRPVHDDSTFFEFLVLEGAQAGLSWLTVLKKREAYRAAFDNFDVEKVASYGDAKIAELLANPGIIRNRLKIGSAVKNARVFLDIRRECSSFDSYMWAYVGGKTVLTSAARIEDLPTRTPVSDAISADLKKRGMSFVGTTIIYSLMQATGIVNDHLVGCPARDAPFPGP